MSIHIKGDERVGVESWTVTIIPDDKGVAPYFVQVDDNLPEALRVAETIVAEDAHVCVYIEPTDEFLAQSIDGIARVPLRDAGGLQ